MKDPASGMRIARTALRASARLLALGAIFGAFALMVDDWRFVQPVNVENILVQSSVVAVAAVGAMLVILAGGLDLSVGSAVALVAVVVASTMKALAEREGMGPLVPLVAALAGVLAAVLVGLFNGLIVVGLRVGPFIATLGTMQIVRGAAKGLAGNSSVYPPDSWLPSLLEPTRQGERSWMILPPGVWLMLLLAMLAALLVQRTRLGRHLVAIGSSEETARLCGVPVGRTKIAVYALAGLCAGVAGVLQFSYIGLGDPTTGAGLELYAIAAAVIGGASLRGGEGSVFGAVAGALIIGVLAAGGVQMRWPSWWQEVMAGAIIVGAVAIEGWRRRRAAA